MRPLEMLTAVMVAAALIVAILPERMRPRGTEWLPVAGGLAALLHVSYEGYRWQMLPLYVLAILLLAIYLPSLVRPGRSMTMPNNLRVSLAILGMLLWLPATALPVLMPVPTMATPSGPYAVGTQTLVMVDDSRTDPYAPNPDEPRRLLVQVWYPAIAPETAGTRNEVPTAWLTNIDVMGPAIADWIGLPSFALDHLTYAVSPAHADAQADTTAMPFPVLLFSHGWGGFRSQSSFLTVELASQGYFVAAIEHPYGSVTTVFPDGRIIPNNPQALPPSSSLPEAEYDATARRLAAQWAADMGFVLDELTAMNDRGAFANQLDLDTVGVFGHSTGGGAAVTFCAADPRCKSGVGLDTFTTPISEQALAEGPQQPFLFLFSEAWPTAKNNRLFDEMAANFSRPTQRLTILGTAHYDFTDLPLLSPLAAQLGLKGPLEGSRVHEIIRTLTLEHFDATLLGVPAGDMAASYPEVRIDGEW